MLLFVGKNRDMMDGLKILMNIDSHVGIERYLVAVELYNAGWRGRLIDEIMGVLK